MDPVNLIIISFRVQYAEKFAEFGGMNFVLHSHCSKFVRNTTTSGSIKPHKTRTSDFGSSIE